jgi:DNA polymerase III epsilon subunit-like protein
MVSAAPPAQSETPRPKFTLDEPGDREEEKGAADGTDVVMMLDELEEPDEFEDVDEAERQAAEKREEEERQDAANRQEEEEEEQKMGIGDLVGLKGMSPQQIASVEYLLHLAQTNRTDSKIHIPKDVCVIAVDLETTGLLIRGKAPPRITELAAVSLSNPSDFISCLVKLPGDVTIHPAAREVSGINEKMCAEFGKSEIEALLDLVVFIQTQIDKHKATKVYLVAHNAFGFDARLIAQAFDRQKFQTNVDVSKVFWVDSLATARASGHDKQNSLGALMKTSFPNFDAKAMHRALADCLALCALIHSNQANMFGSLFFGEAGKKFEEFNEK